MSILPLLHPFFFALSSPLSHFAVNMDIVYFSETISGFLAAIGLAVAVLVPLKMVLRNSEKAAIITSGFLLLFFSFGHVFLVLREVNSTIGKHIYLLLLILTALFARYVYYFVTTSKPLRFFTKLLNFVGIVSVVFPLMNIIKSQGPKAWARQEGFKKAESIVFNVDNPQNLGPLRDIYYIILDRYGAADTLKEVYDFDNSDFVNYLTDMGFYVAHHSIANYLKTAHSLAASFNMNYLNDLGDQLGREETDWRPIYAMLQDHEVQRFLKSQGYRYVHLGSWWEPTRRNEYADHNVDVAPFPRFFYSVYEMSMLAPIGIPLGLLDFRLTQWKRELRHFDELEEIANDQEPTFVFAHLLVTHPPYVFGPGGEFLKKGEVTKRSHKKNYTDSIVFVNQKMKGVVDKLLAQPKELQPIIVVQADEGPWPERIERNEFRFNWQQATKDELREKMRILNAYYLPGVDNTALYPTISPVNSFRVIFNLYFHTDLQLLPDVSYAFMDQRHPYSFFDITDVIKHD